MVLLLLSPIFEVVHFRGSGKPTALPFGSSGDEIRVVQREVRISVEAVNSWRGRSVSAVQRYPEEVF